MPYVGYGGPMQLLAVGHKRTGACPTFERPVLQRDGLLVRITLVGGALTGTQAAVVADVAASTGSGVVELTNRGNLQVRGVRDDAVDDALARIRAAGLGDRGAALVTISPFAGPVEHALRRDVLAALDRDLADGPALSPKFVVHVDDAAGWTAGRRAEAVLAAAGGGCTVRIAGVGQQAADRAGAVAAVRVLAAACRDGGEQARVADVLALEGRTSLVARLPLAGDRWEPLSAPAPAFDGIGPLGTRTGPDGTDVVVAAAPLGRVDAAQLGALAALASLRGTGIRVTPWRSFAVAAPLGALEQLGLVVDPLDPAAGVVACVGAGGCWQSEADALAEARRQIALRSNGTGAVPLGGGVLHVSGCDKRCATRSAVAVTLVGRPDGSGFDLEPAR